VGYLSQIHREQRRMTTENNVVHDESVEGKCLVCKLCNGLVFAREARAHIQACWKVTLRPDEPIPAMKTRFEVQRWIQKRGDNGTKTG
jgi:hypothetical protein